MYKHRGKTSLQEQSYDIIQAHVIDPENSPLPKELQEQFDRVVTAAKLLDDYPNDTHITRLMRVKYKVSLTQCTKDLRLAKELFKSRNKFDWDFWFAWQIKDQLELIRKCKLQGNLKEWNKAKIVLNKILGEKPEAVDDPRRMEKNTFVIQVSSATGQVAIDLNKIRNLDNNSKKEIIDTFAIPIDDKQAEDIINS